MVAVAVMAHNGDTARLAAYIKRAKKLDDIYDGDPDEDIFVPSSLIEGRVNPLGKTFTGIITSDGKLRIDCAEQPEFWMNVNLAEIPEFKFEPNREAAKEAEKHFEQTMEKKQQA
jgi:hypothetical protein